MPYRRALTTHARPRWRDDDEALLTHLDGTELLARVWRIWTPIDAHPPSRFATSMWEALSTVKAAQPALQEARRGRAEALIPWLEPNTLHELPSVYCHHLALLHAQRARILADYDAHRAKTACSRHYAVACWLQLIQDRTYITELTETIASGDLDASAVDHVIKNQAFNFLTELATIVVEGARARTEKASATLYDLRHLPAFLERFSFTTPVVDHVVNQAERIQTSTLDQALQHLESSLQEATVKNASYTEFAELFEDAASLWRWGHRHIVVERFLVTHTVSTLWRFHRANHTRAMRTLLTPLQAPVESLEDRLNKSTAEMAFAAPCAQMLVFLAEEASDSPRRIALLERALVLCPNHRNARVVLSQSLIARAVETMNRMGWRMRKKALSQAHADLSRAEDLYPGQPQLKKAQKTLLKMGYKERP